jgi:hypothetical protein
MTLGRRGHDAQMRRGRALEPPRVLHHGDRRKAHGTGRGEPRGERCVAFTRHPSHDTVPPLLDHHQK